MGFSAGPARVLQSFYRFYKCLWGPDAIAYCFKCRKRLSSWDHKLLFCRVWGSGP